MLHGETPLADGLNKAISMARLEKHKKAGSRVVVILISDCNPEPLTTGCSNILEDPAYNECIKAASQYRKNKISLLIINPAFKHTQAEREINQGNGIYDPYRIWRAAGSQISVKYYPGEILSMILSKKSGGKLIKPYDPDKFYDLDGTCKPDKKEINRIINKIQDFLNSR
jgi:hypothetical protein